MIGANHPELVREFASDLTPSLFFDNPIGSSVLMRPMDVVKPPQEELQKNKPGVPLPPMKYNLKDTVFPFFTRPIPITVMDIVQPSLPPDWRPLEGVVNNMQYYGNATPNVFFRFHCQLYLAYCDFDWASDKLCQNVQHVPSLLLFHRRCWRCAGSRTRWEPLLHTSIRGRSCRPSLLRSWACRRGAWWTW